MSEPKRFNVVLTVTVDPDGEREPTSEDLKSALTWVVDDMVGCEVPPLGHEEEWEGAPFVKAVELGAIVAEERWAIYDRKWGDWSPLGEGVRADIEDLADRWNEKHSGRFEARPLPLPPARRRGSDGGLGSRKARRRGLQRQEREDDRGLR